jgi:hypothetical protein
MSAISVAPTPEVQAPPTPTEQLRTKRNACTARAATLLHRAVELTDEINAQTIALRQGRVQDGTKLAALVKEQTETEKQIKIVNAERSDCDLQIQRIELKANKEKFDATCTEMMALRFEIVDLLRQAADKYGRFIMLQHSAPELANRSRPEGWAAPQDRTLLNDLAAPFRPYTGSWIAERNILTIELNDGTAPRLMPTAKLGAKL